MFISAAVASDPVITSLEPISSSSVRVEWSQPSGGATVTGYVIHYSDGDTDRTESVLDSLSTSPITSQWRLPQNISLESLVLASSVRLAI